jgi:very-short-patch-repair endonuclease
MREDETSSRPLAKHFRRNLTPAEARLWSHLKRHGIHGLSFRRQHPIGPYVADFACVGARLVVEVDGGTHSTPEQLAHDRRRDGFLRKSGWRIIRVSNVDVYKKINSVLDYIARHVEPFRKVPPPSAAQTPPP